MLRLASLQKHNNAQSYYIAVITMACLYFAFALLFDHLQIHIYRHDSAYNITMEQYFYNLRSEGRWINYLLIPVYSSIPGRLAASLDLLFLFLFFLVVCNRWTKSFTYAFLVALLAMQIEPFTVQIMWPVNILPALLFLAMSAWASQYLSVYLFYLLFGVLLAGTFSNLYFLLPLVHLNLLDSTSAQRNFRVLLLRLLPAWVLGYIAGYLIVLLVLYLFTDTWGIQIAPWRAPNYIHSLQDLLINAQSSFVSLQHHVFAFFTGVWRNLLLVTALMIGFFGTRKSQYAPLALLSLAIIAAHYVAVIPAGLGVHFRTATMTWLGILVLFFFYPAIKKWQYNLLAPIILLITFSFYRVNHEHLTWYASITNAYFDELVHATPQPPEFYKGVVFLSSSEDVERVNRSISTRLGLNRGHMEPFVRSRPWPSVARAAGFTNVLLCKDREKETEVCRNLSRATNDWSLQAIHEPGLYRVYGEWGGYLILSLNDHTDLEL